MWIKRITYWSRLKRRQKGKVTEILERRSRLGNRKKGPQIRRLEQYAFTLANECVDICCKALPYTINNTAILKYWEHSLNPHSVFIQLTRSFQIVNILISIALAFD